MPRIYMSPPHMSGRELELVREVFESNWIAPVGPHLNRLEQQFAERLGVQAAVALASGTAAIHLALRHLKIRPGDEIICPSFTFAASANPIRYEHAEPVFIDSDEQTWNMDPNLLAAELAECDRRGKLPRAIIAVDILGQSADLDAILEVAGRYEIPVIEDAAEVLGGTYKDRAAGSSGWTGAFSFNGNKIITSSGGGMLISNDEAAIDHVRFLSTQAKDPGSLYLHSEIGFNYRLSNVCAAIALGQLEVLDERVARRKWIHEYYRAGLSDLPGIGFMPIASYGEPNYWLTTITVDKSQFGQSCEDIRQALEELNIESRRLWVPLHQQKSFAGFRCRGGEVADKIFDIGLCLPSGTAMNEQDLERTINRIRELALPS